MKDMMKVTQIKSKSKGSEHEFDAWTTLKVIVCAVFGEEIATEPHDLFARIIIDGVKFKPVMEHIGYGTGRLLGVSMTVSTGMGRQRTEQRRVMLVDPRGDNCAIDRAALKGRFDVLKSIALMEDGYAERDRKRRAASTQLRKDVIAQLEGYPEDLDLQHFARIEVHSPDHVTLRADVTGIQLVEIETIIGEPHKVTISLPVTKEEAVRVYNALKPVKPESEELTEYEDTQVWGRGPTLQEAEKIEETKRERAA